MEKHNSTLASHATAVETQHAAMMRQMGEYSSRLQTTAAQNQALQREIAHLRALLEVRVTLSHRCLMQAHFCRFPKRRCNSPAVASTM